MARAGKVTVDVTVNSELCAVRCLEFMCKHNRVNIGDECCNLKRLDVGKGGQCVMYEHDDGRVIQKMRSEEVDDGNGRH